MFFVNLQTALPITIGELNILSLVTSADMMVQELSRTLTCQSTL